MDSWHRMKWKCEKSLLYGSMNFHYVMSYIFIVLFLPSEFTSFLIWPSQHQHRSTPSSDLAGGAKELLLVESRSLMRRADGFKPGLCSCREKPHPTQTISQGSSIMTIYWIECRNSITYPNPSKRTEIKIFTFTPFRRWNSLFKWVFVVKFEIR